MLDGKLSHETCTWVVPSQMTQISLFQPHPRTISHSKLFHNFLPHTLLHNHLFSSIRSIIKKKNPHTNTWSKTRLQKQIHMNTKSQTQIWSNLYKIHKHKSPIFYQHNQITNTIPNRPIARSAMREREREREREELNHTQPNQFWIMRHS